MSSSPYRLKVQQVDQSCLFELTWGQGQHLSAQLPYPKALIAAYQNWQRLYLSFYKTAQLPPMPVAEPPDALRGRAMGGGNLASETANGHIQLVEAEAKLLSGFHLWLQSTKAGDEVGLYKIRKEIARASQRLMDTPQAALDLFLTCSPMELARLPWEEWEIGADFATGRSVQIVRTPANIHAEATTTRRRKGRPRVLAILGDDTGLDFQADRQAVRSLERKVAEIRFVGWQPGKTIEQVKQEICQALLDEEGWDVLFFAGHSNESQNVGGELSIAPKTSISIKEIAARLTVARQNGLQFALFNSCSGLQIAESLIDLGFAQVAIMREPIHNRVAQEFLVEFMNALAQHQNVQQSLQSAYQLLKLEKNITYPSTYLVPSLFCHPGAELYKIPRVGWRYWMRYWAPSRTEAIAVGASCLLSLLPATQSLMLERRVWVQSLYRDLTQQVPPASSPPVALVLVDDASVRKDSRLTDPSPIDREYLAELITKLSDQGAEVIGVDYLLDRKTGEEAVLKSALQQAVQQRQTWLTFATLYHPFEEKNIFTLEQSGIASRNWTLQAHSILWFDRVTLPFRTEDCRQTCPFAYLLSLIHRARQETDSLPLPRLSNTTDLRTQLIDQIEQFPSPSLAKLQQTRLGWIGMLTSKTLQLATLEPIIDFSIPPDRIYQGIAAWQVIEDVHLDLSQINQQVVIIGAGDYQEGGVELGGMVDLSHVPAAMHYWRSHLPENHRATFGRNEATGKPLYQRYYAGAEAHAYMVHHLLNQHLVTPIPTIWMMGVAVVLGRSGVLLIRRQDQSRWTSRRRRGLALGLAGATLAYGLISLQLYVMANLIFPWFLPSVMFWIYIFPAIKRRKTRV